VSEPRVRARSKPLYWAVYSKGTAQAASVHAAVLPWLEQAGLPGGAHGADLLHALVHDFARPEQVVEPLLAWWCSIELCSPSKLSQPTQDQRFLGAGGTDIGYAGRGKPPPRHVPSWYRWARVGPIWLRGSG